MRHGAAKFQLSLALEALKHLFSRLFFVMQPFSAGGTPAAQPLVWIGFIERK